MSPVPPGCWVLLLLAAAPAIAEPPSRSPFAAWAADVAAPSRTAALPWFGRPRIDPDDGGGRADLSRVLHATLDRSGPLVGADAAHTMGLSGRGTLVAVIDSGVDFSHLAFLDETGRPRIVWYLDLTLPPRERGPLDDRGGALFDRDDLARALRDPAAPRPSPDLSGHGTRVASIAAGDELPAPGVAPAADLLVVRADRLPGGRYDEADVADALAFVFQAADFLGRPCVVNLSLGGQAGAHDGSSWLERAIDAALASGPAGRAVVVAAGNDGDAAVHARLVARPESPGRLALVVPANRPLPGAPAAFVALDLWSTGARTFYLAVDLPDGSRYARAPGDPGLDVPLPGGAALRLEPAATDDDGRSEALAALVGGDDGAIPSGRYLVTVHGNATVDVWLTVEAETPLFPVRLDGPVASDTTLSIPATARRAIVVGSLTTRSSWTNHLGDCLEIDSPALGAASSFTGRGPTADGRFKPDLAAPGEWVLAAHSAAADWPVLPGGLVATGPDPQVSAGRGTSLAAPHVTGAVALLLERDPSLRASDILARLRAAARGGGRWNDATGFGQLDLLSLLASPPTASGPDTVALSVARSFFPADGSRTTEIAVRRRTGDPPSARVVPRLRYPAALSVRPIGSGPLWLAALDASRLASGECAELTAVGDDGSLADRVSLCVVPDHPAGCTVGGFPAGRWSPFWPFCLCLLAVRLARSAHHPGRWTVFAAVSVGAHLVVLAVLARWLPLSQPPLRSSLVAAAIVADVRPPETPRRLVPVRAPSSPAPPPIALARVSVHATRPPAPPRTIPRVPRPAASLPSSAPAAPASSATVTPPAPVSTDPPLPLPSASDQAPHILDPPDAPPRPPQPPAEPEGDACVRAAADLRTAIDARKRYPALARRRGLSGTTLVTFTTETDGTLATLAVARSSGSDLLDEAALAAVRSAAPFAATGCSFSVPIQFRLAGPDR